MYPPDLGFAVDQEGSSIDYGHPDIAVFGFPHSSVDITVHFFQAAGHRYEGCFDIPGIPVDVVCDHLSEFKRCGGQHQVSGGEPRWVVSANGIIVIYSVKDRGGV